MSANDDPQISQNPSQAQPPAPEPLPKSHAWSPDDTVALVFAFIGFIGGVLLLQYYRAAPIVIAFFLATGVAALVYKFLGGVVGTTFTVGALKLGGTLAAIVGIALLINGYLVKQVQFRLLTDADIVGEWKWVYGQGAWSGHINIAKDGKGNLIFTGEQFKYSDEKTRVPMYSLTNGKAQLINRNSLLMEADVEDHIYHSRFHWKSVDPVLLTPAFQGRLQGTVDGKIIEDGWGIMFYKDRD